MSSNFEYLNMGAGDWEDVSPMERQKNQELHTFVFKEPLINRVQRFFLWPMEKVHEALAEYTKFLLLKDELEDYDATILVVPPMIARVWEAHIVDTIDYRMGLEKTLGLGVFFDHQPEVFSTMEEEVKAEKISQLQLFFRGKFGRDPNPYFWSFDSSSASPSGAMFPPPNGSSNSSRFPSRDESDASSRRVNPTAMYPAGSGRFSRDLGTGGFTRLARMPKPMIQMNWRRPSMSFGGNGGSPRRWNEGEDNGKVAKEMLEAKVFGTDDVVEGNASKTTDGSIGLPNLESFIGGYKRRRDETSESTAAAAAMSSSGDGGIIKLSQKKKDSIATHTSEATSEFKSIEIVPLSEAAPESSSVQRVNPGAEKDPETTNMTAIPVSKRTITFVVKCKYPFRFRHVIADWPRDSSVGELKMEIRQVAENLPPSFALSILETRIDDDEWKSLEELNVLDGDIIHIQPL